MTSYSSTQNLESFGYGPWKTNSKIYYGNPQKDTNIKSVEIKPVIHDTVHGVSSFLGVHGLTPIGDDRK